MIEIVAIALPLFVSIALYLSRHHSMLPSIYSWITVTITPTSKNADGHAVRGAVPGARFSAVPSRSSISGP
jgi:hypothetical protein